MTSEKSLCNLFFKRAFTRRKGRNNVTVDDLVHVITPKGRGGYISVYVSIFHNERTGCFLGHVVICNSHADASVVNLIYYAVEIGCI